MGTRIRRISRRRVSAVDDVVAEAKAAAALREVLGEASPPKPKFINGVVTERQASCGGA